MLMKWRLNLRLFDGDGAGAAPAGGESGGEAAAVAPGVLDDGTQVDNRLAARMEQQAKRRQARGAAPVASAAPQAQGEADATPEGAQTAQEPSLEERWNELRRGEFREQYARDVQNAIQDRFRNQADANNALNKLRPMLSALAQQKGVEDGNWDELSRVILDDDSLYEEAADEAGMSVESYKLFKQLQDEHDQREAQREMAERQQFLYGHFQKLAQQAEALKQTFPDFDLRKELENPAFVRMTGPNGGFSVEDAYHAIHWRELQPQAMAYGIQRATQQISQNIQANRQRPTEGAMKGGQGFDVSIDPRSMSREQREELKQRARRGEKIVF